MVVSPIQMTWEAGTLNYVKGNAKIVNEGLNERLILCNDFPICNARTLFILLLLLSLMENIE